ncbi:hypothetical protein ACNKHT_26245 [Shigella flexneri]
MITFVKSLTHARLLINHVIGMVRVPAKEGGQSGIVAVKWVLIEFYNAADGVTESFDGMVPRWVQPPPTF